MNIISIYILFLSSLIVFLIVRWRKECQVTFSYAKLKLFSSCKETKILNKRTSWRKSIRFLRISVTSLFIVMIMISPLGPFQPQKAKAADGDRNYYALLVASGTKDTDILPNLLHENLVNNNIEKIQQILLNLSNQQANWSPQRIFSIYNNQASPDAVQNAIQTIGSSMDEDDVFLFYYSGHGAYSETTSYFSLHSRDDPSFENSRLIADFEFVVFLDYFLPEQSKKIVFIESCHSGGFVDEFREENTSNTIVISSSHSSETSAFWNVFVPSTFVENSLASHYFFPDLRDVLIPIMIILLQLKKFFPFLPHLFRKP